MELGLLISPFGLYHCNGSIGRYGTKQLNIVAVLPHLSRGMVIPRSLPCTLTHYFSTRRQLRASQKQCCPSPERKRMPILLMATILRTEQACQKERNLPVPIAYQSSLHSAASVNPLCMRLPSGVAPAFFPNVSPSLSVRASVQCTSNSTLYPSRDFNR